MGAVDPTYPFYPVASFLAAALLLILLLTGFVRQSWNLGVTFMCSWLFLENIINGANAIIWSDNDDIKLKVYCDIATRVRLVSSVVRSTATLIITRRLYLIVSLQSVEALTIHARRWDAVIEWTLGLLIPLVVAGPFYYIVQGVRFQVYEGFGCVDAQVDSVLSFLIVPSWSIVFPLLSIMIYHPKVAYTFYRHFREVNRFLHSNDSVSRANYFRVLVLASIDILITLPFNTVNIALSLQTGRDTFPWPFYPGWEYVHTNWGPISVPYSALITNTLASAELYLNQWTTPVLAFAVFGLFGLTGEAFDTYRRVFRAVCGCKAAIHVQEAAPSALETIEFSMRPQEISYTSESHSRVSFTKVTYPTLSTESVEEGVGEHLEKADRRRQVSAEIGPYMYAR